MPRLLDARTLKYAAGTATRICRAENRLDELDEYIAQAHYALFVAWPALVERFDPDPPPLPVVGQLVMLRLIDWYRSQKISRGGVQRPLSNALPLEGHDPAAVELEQFGDQLSVTEVLDELRLTGRDRLICRRVAEGVRYVDIGLEVGLSQGRLTQILHKIGTDTPLLRDVLNEVVNE